MKYKFWKYQGTGNDFIFFDGRQSTVGIKDNKKVIERLCDRRFGIGADGLIILEEDTDTDFRMVYYNSDGSESTMCGNGGRCAVAFARLAGFSGESSIFDAIDGRHEAKLRQDLWVELGMIDVDGIERLSKNIFVLDTGSPHYVYFKDKREDIDIVAFGKSVRYSDQYKADGINVNVVEVQDDKIIVETYERGVEDETLSCGTGVTAAAIAYNEFSPDNRNRKVLINTKGGKLEVSFQQSDKNYSKIFLTGPATFVYEGVIKI